MSDQLAEFLRRKEQAAGPPIDWQAKRDGFVRSVEELYTLVKSMLRESIESKAVTVRTFEMDVTEDYIGTYTIPALELTIGGERVEFRPKGALVVGAAGRMDMRGGRDTVTLVRNTNGEGDDWAIVLQRVPHLRTAPFDRESLTYALERVMLPLS
jgi:hypothetical protein